MPSLPSSAQSSPACPGPHRGLGLGLALALAVIAGCEDLPLEVTVPSLSRVATSPTPSGSGSPRGSASPSVAPASSVPGATAAPVITPVFSPSPALSPSPSPPPSPTPVPSRTPAPSPTPTVSPTINPAAPARVRFEAPLESANFTGSAIDIAVKAELPDDEAIVLEKLQVFYDGVELARQESADVELTIAGWNPHVVNSVGNRDPRPVPHGPHVLRAVATTTAGTVTTAELAFDKPFLFRGWKTNLLKDGTEQPLPTLLPARSNMALVAIQNRLFTWFGENAADNLTELRMLHLDVFSPSWTTRPEPAFERRKRAGAVAAGDRIYLIGGEGVVPPNTVVVTADVTSYDVFLNRKDLTPPDLPETRTDAAVAKLDRFLYVAGGYQNPGPTTIRPTLYRLELNDLGAPVGTPWQPLADMPDGEGRAGATLVPHAGKLYLFGGITGANTTAEPILKYDPGSNAWSREALLPRGVAYAAGASLGDHVWLFGGDASTSAEKRVLNDTVRFDPRTRTIKTFSDAETNLPDARAGAGAIVVNGQLFLVGGYRYAQDGSREFLGETLRADTL